MKILENEDMIEKMDFFEFFPEEDLASSIEMGLKSEDGYERIVAIELVDISINGVDEDIVGNTDDYFDFIKRVENEFLIYLKKDACVSLQNIKEENIDPCLIEKIKKRLMQAN